jgi:hypothetical protein
MELGKVSARNPLDGVLGPVAVAKRRTSSCAMNYVTAICRCPDRRVVTTLHWVTSAPYFRTELREACALSIQQDVHKQSPMASDSKKTRQCKYLHLFLFADHRRLMTLRFFFGAAQQMGLCTTSLNNAYSGDVRSFPIRGREGGGGGGEEEGRLESSTPMEYPYCVVCIMARLQIPELTVRKPGVPHRQRGGKVPDVIKKCNA